MSESNFLNLIPTSNLLNYTDLLNGNLSSDEIIVKLSKTEDIGKWNPENLNEILFKFKVDSLEFMNRDRFFKFNIRIPEEIKSSTDYLINEVGLFFKDKAKNNDILIAYVYIENSLSLIELEGFFLQLILPYPINQEMDLELVEEQNNLIYSKLEKKGNTDTNNIGDNTQLNNYLIECYDNHGQPLRASKWNKKVIEKERVFLWEEVYKNEIDFSRSLSLLDISIPPNSNSIYYFYKEKNKSNIYIRRYHLDKDELAEPRYVLALKEPTVERYGTIGQSDDKFIRCYLSHRAGVFCIKVSKLKNVKSSYHQQYHPSRVGDNTTLFSLDNNAALGGGDIAGWTSGKAFSASGVNYESWVCLGPSEVIDCGCDNPIVDYFKENDELVVICSGRETKIDEEEITPDKKGKGKIIIEEENLIEVNVSNTVVKTANIQYEQPTFKNKKFSYLSFLSPKKKERSIITYKTREDYNDFCHVNALTHMSCRYNDELFIFPRDIFQNPEHDKFFSFNRTKKKVNSYFIPEKIRESVQKNNMMFYDQVQVASTHKNLIYFSLNKYNQKTKKLSTQIFELEVDANQEN